MSSSIYNVQEKSIYFEYDSSDLTPGGKSYIKSTLEEARKSLLRKIIITCYADRAGELLYNQSLSEERCDRVESFLNSQQDSEDCVPIIKNPIGETDMKYKTDDGVREPGSRRVSLQVLTFNPIESDIKSSKSHTDSSKTAL